MSEKKFTRRDLLKYNGKNRSKVYIVYRGKVYDVSNSFTWRTGNHQVLHEAGKDLTDELKQAPHGTEMLDCFPIIGMLCED